MLTNESSRMTSNFGNSQRVKHKIIFLGDQHVGKTCIIERFMYDVFTEKTHPTVGVDFLAKTLHIDDKNIRLQLWDTAGQERFRSLIPSYLRDATCAVIVYDVTKKDSFISVDRWIQEYRENRGPDAACVLVANKIDLGSQREVTEDEGRKKAGEYFMSYFEISAKSGENVNNMFKSMAIALQPMENSMISAAVGNFQYDNQENQNGQGGTASQAKGQTSQQPQNAQQSQQGIQQQNQQSKGTIKLGEGANGKGGAAQQTGDKKNQSCC